MNKITIWQLLKFKTKLGMDELWSVIYDSVEFLELEDMRLFLNSRQDWVINQITEELQKLSIK